MIPNPSGLVLSHLRARPLRAWLTILGIVIGVAAIFSLITVSYGLRNAIASQFEKLGTDRLMVMPAGFAPPGTLGGLTVEDAHLLEALKEFEYVIPYLFSTMSVTYKGDTSAGYVWSIPAEHGDTILEDYDMSITEGRNIGPGDMDVAVIGPLTGDVLFKRTIRVNDIMFINGRKIRVIGIFLAEGSPEHDSQLLVPVGTMRDILGEDERVDYLDLKLKAGFTPEDGVRSVKRALGRTHKSDDFQVLTPDQLQQQFGVLITVIEVIIVGIAGISLVVGGVGIMNSMFTSVLERTREIGVLKAVGATRSHIMAVFLAESALVALIGGAIGILAGIALSLSVQAVASGSDWGGLLAIRISPWLVLFSMGFSLAVGGLSGLLPAGQAARLQPVVALRS